MIIKNAIIESTTLDIGDRDLLQGWLHLDYGGLHQGFGGSALYLPESYKHHKDAMRANYAGHWLYRVMKIADVGEWKQLPGKTIRVKLDKDGLGSNIIAIGHIINDDWFNPEEDFSKMKAELMT